MTNQIIQSKIELKELFLWMKNFMKYVYSRAITAVLGTLILFLFSDTLGYSAWIVNIVWIPISLIMGYTLFKKFEKK